MSDVTGPEPSNWKLETIAELMAAGFVLLVYLVVRSLTHSGRFEAAAISIVVISGLFVLVVLALRSRRRVSPTRSRSPSGGLSVDDDREPVPTTGRVPLWFMVVIVATLASAELAAIIFN